MKKISFFLLLLITLASCRKEPLPEPSQTPEETVAPTASLQGNIDQEGYVDARQIVLGKRMVNAYSVENMQRAFDYYNGIVPDSRFQDKVVRASHKYIKILPENESDLKALDAIDDNPTSSTLVLHDYPLDYEILQEGEYYINPSSEADVYHPVYTVVPVNEEVPGNLNYEIIEQLYEPTDEEEDVETVSLVLSGWKDDIIADFGKELTERDLPGLFNNQERLFGRRYRPYGWVEVENTELGDMDRLRRAKISIGRSIWWRYTNTDNDGYFRSPKKYRGRVRIRAKWRSSSATIRTSWNEMLGFWVSDHLMTITRGGNGRTKRILNGSDHLWYKGTIHNGIVQYNDYCNLHGIDKIVVGANVWVWKNGENASAPMLKQFPQLGALSALAGVGEGDFWNGLTTTVAGLLIQPIQLVFGHLMPDKIYAGLRGRTEVTGGIANSARIHQLVFHESSHFSHAKKAGASNWANVFAAEFNNYLDYNDPYHEGVNPNVADGEHIALAEGWAAYQEFRIMLWTYLRYWDGEWWTGADGINYLENFDMYTVPMTEERDDNDSWFLSGLINDIVDEATDEDNDTNLRDGTNGNPLNPIVDNVTGISDADVFQSLTSSVRSMCDLKSRLEANVGGSADLDDLFESYGCDDDRTCFIFSITGLPTFPQPLYDIIRILFPQFYQLRDDFMQRTVTGRRYIEDFYTLGTLVKTRKVDLSLSAAKEIMTYVVEHKNKVDLLNRAEQNASKVLYTLQEAEELTDFVTYLKTQGQGDPTWDNIMKDILEDIEKFKGLTIAEIEAAL